MLPPSIKSRFVWPKRLVILYPFSALLLGMFVSQVLATAHVYLSNLALFDSLTAIKDAGYLTIPNQNVIRGLKDFGTAFYGGLFFTFSIGAGVSFFSLALTWVWDRLFFRKRSLLYMYLSLWLLCLFALNFHGIKLFVTLYFLIIPPVVFTFTARSLSHSNQQNTHRNEIVHIIPVLVLGLLLGWQADDKIFADFRDTFLLSNPVGSAINDFYYKYTLYPAEVFKSLDQKMLKTCRVEKITNIATARILEKTLISYDYIPIKGNIAVDLAVIQTDNEFILENRGKSITRIGFKEFFTNPDRAITSFANKSDTHSFFRRLTFRSLLIGLPIAVYVIGHGLIALIFSLFLQLRTSSVIASGISFTLCLILFFTFHFNRSPDVSIEEIPDALNSGRWQKRVAALKIIEEKGLEIRSFKAYPKLLASTHIPERYWFIRTLANSRSSATYRDLLNFLDDPNHNVLTMAFYALGQRGNRRAISKILNKIETSNDWYSQWYAYKALRSLGWKQTKLK